MNPRPRSAQVGRWGAGGRAGAGGGAGAGGAEVGDAALAAEEATGVGVGLATGELTGVLTGGLTAGEEAGGPLSSGAAVAVGAATAPAPGRSLRQYRHRMASSLISSA